VVFNLVRRQTKGRWRYSLGDLDIYGRIKS